METPKNPGVPPQPGQEGFTPQQQQELAALMELGLSGLMAAPDEEGASLGGITAAILEETKRGREMSPERLQQLEEGFDHGLAVDVNSILENYDRLYYPSEWELETQLKNMSSVKTRLERRIQTFEKKKEISESGTLTSLRRIYKKVLWAQGIETVLAGGMISTATYYAGEERIKNIPKIKITGKDNMQAYHETLSGLVTEEIKEGVVNREVIVQMQDTAMEASYLVAMGLHQRSAELTVSDTPATEPRQREKMYIDKPTRDFMEDVFAARDIKLVPDPEDPEGKKMKREDHGIIKVNWVDPNTGKSHEVSKDIINYFSLQDNTEGGRRMYINLMTAFVYMDAINRFNKGEDPIKLAKKIRDEAYSLQDNAYSVGMYTDTKELYANIITRAMISKHLGDMSAGELGWGWVYEVATYEEDLFDAGADGGGVEQVMFKKCAVTFDQLTKKQQEDVEKRRDIEAKQGKQWKDLKDYHYVVVRVSEIGSIYNADDIPSPFYPERYVEEYQARAESASEVYKGLADSFRRLTRYYPPDWSPPIQEFCANNPVMLQWVDYLVNDKYAGRPERRGAKPYGKKDYRVTRYMAKYARAWPTWVTVNGKPYAVPMFYPPAWYSLNFWRSLGHSYKKKDDGTMESKYGGKMSEVPSLHERFMERNKLSKVDFTQYSDQVVDWSNVNRAQLARGLVVLFLSNQFSSDGSNQFGNFVARPLNINTLKDWDKRMARLGVRGEDVVAGVTGMLTFVPIAVKLIAEKSGVGQLGDPKLKANQTRRQEIEKSYRDAIASMKLNAFYLPKSKGLSKTAIQNFNNTYSMVIDTYAKIEMDWQIKAAAQNQSDLLDEAVPFQEDMAAILKMNGLSSSL